MSTNKIRVCMTYLFVTSCLPPASTISGGFALYSGIMFSFSAVAFRFPLMGGSSPSLVVRFPHLEEFVPCSGIYVFFI